MCVCVCVSIYISLNSSLWFFGIHLCFQQRPSCHTSDLTLSRTLIIQEYLPKIGLRPRSYLLPNKIIPDTPISLAEFSGSAHWITMYLLLFGTAVKKKNDTPSESIGKAILCVKLKYLELKDYLCFNLYKNVSMPRCEKSSVRKFNRTLFTFC